MPPIPLPETDSVPLEGETPLTVEERLWLRRLRRDQARLRWLGRVVYKSWPFWAWMAGVAVALAHGVIWLKEHIHFIPKAGG